METWLMTYEGLRIAAMSLFVVLITTISKAVLFKKAGLPARWAFVPVYREYLRFRLAGKPKWTWRLLCPPIAFIVQIMANFYVAKKFQKSDFFAMGISAVPVLFLPMMAITPTEDYCSESQHSWSFVNRLFVWLCGIVMLCAGSLWGASKYPGKYPALDLVNQYLNDYAHKFSGGLWSEGTLFSEDEYHMQDEDALSREELQPYIAQLEAGDVLFTASEKYTSSYVIPGQRKHAFLYIGSGEIIDASGTYGVAKRKLIDLNNLRRGSILNGLLAYRPQLNEQQKSDFLSFIEKQIGKEYDFGFKGKDDTFYCSNLISEGLKSVGVVVDYTTELFGITAVSPVNMVDYIEEKGLKAWEFTRVFLAEKSGNIDSSIADQTAAEASAYCLSQSGTVLTRYVNSQEYLACLLPDDVEVGAIELWRASQLGE